MRWKKKTPTHDLNLVRIMYSANICIQVILPRTTIPIYAAHRKRMRHYNGDV